MIKKLLVCTWTLLALNAPAFADCAQEISQLDTRFREAEAQSGQSPATPHQADTLQTPNGQTGSATNMPAAGSAPDAASSEHQREVLGAGQQSDQETFAAQLQEARQLAQTGDEAGCLARVGEAEKLLGTR